MDHAGRNETSLMLHYRPDLVDLSQLPANRGIAPVGVGGQDPRDATAELGRGFMEQSIEVVRQMFEKAGLLG
jgi:creatinine amidohydrolase/Fe(II)-dependent formamide hydrolase-like protein